MQFVIDMKKLSCSEWKSNKESLFSYASAESSEFFFFGFFFFILVSSMKLGAEFDSNREKLNCQQSKKEEQFCEIRQASLHCTSSDTKMPDNGHGINTYQNHITFFS